MAASVSVALFSLEMSQVEIVHRLLSEDRVVFEGRHYRLDGAQGFGLFRHIVLPLSLPILLSSVIFSLNGTIKVFDSVLALTHGGVDGPSIVAEIRNPTNLEAARLVGADRTVLLDIRETVAKLVVQTSRQLAPSFSCCLRSSSSDSFLAWWVTLRPSKAWPSGSATTRTRRRRSCRPARRAQPTSASPRSRSGRSALPLPR